MYNFMSCTNTYYYHEDLFLYKFRKICNKICVIRNNQHSNDCYSLLLC